MGLLGNIISVRENKKQKELSTEGFTLKEIQNLEFIFNRMRNGRTFGGLAAFAYSNYMLYNHFSVPLRKRCITTFPKTIIISTTIYFASCYLFNSNRKRGDAFLSNIYSNNALVLNRNELVRNFKNFNRKFTDAEKQQFVFNEQLIRRGQKKYTYNKFVHGNEEEFKKRHQAWNKGELYLNEKTMLEIENGNRFKTENREVVMVKPFRVLDHVDFLGLKKHKLKTFSLFEKNHVI